MVKAVVDQMLDYDPIQTRALCHNIGRTIIMSHLECFADVARNGDILEKKGCYYLLQQIKTWVEYNNRNNTLVRQRRKKEIDKERCKTS